MRVYRTLKNFLRQKFIYRIQEWNRLYNSSYLESSYQMNYLDLARRTEWLAEVPLSSPTGGTASFSLLYFLLSLLREKRIANILELGVGQSSLLLIQYARRFNARLTLIDDDEEWMHKVFPNNAEVDDSMICAICTKLVPTSVKDKTIQWYNCQLPDKTFDLLLVDGPIAYSKHTQYNRLGILNWLPHIMQEEFVILLDDTNRIGERLLANSMMEIFERHGVKVWIREVVGRANQTLILTSKFKHYIYL